MNLILWWITWSFVCRWPFPVRKLCKCHPYNTINWWIFMVQNLFKVSLEEVSNVLLLLLAVDEKRLWLAAIYGSTIYRVGINSFSFFGSNALWKSFRYRFHLLARTNSYWVLNYWGIVPDLATANNFDCVLSKIIILILNLLNAESIYIFTSM